MSFSEVSAIFEKFFLTEKKVGDICTLDLMFDILSKNKYLKMFI